MCDSKKVEFSLERKKKNEQIKGLISNILLVFCCTIQLITSSLSSFVPNFRALSEAVAEKSLTERKKDLHWREKEEK